MRYLSVCSGIEAATVALRPLGFSAVAFAEIDPFACALLEHYYPDVPNLGDITAIDETTIASLGPIDLVVGGTPCQDLSVAGRRAGIDGERSRVFYDFVRIFDAARRFCGARWCLWENVPGSFTSHAGGDFAVVVATLAGLDELVVPRGGWGNEGLALGPRGLVEWSVLDAQWFDLAQRRERVFALLDSGRWADRPPLLLEPESLRGDSPPRRATGEDVAGTLTRSALDGSSACGGDGRDGLMVAGTVSAKWAKGTGGPSGDECQNLVVANTLAANAGRHQIEQTYIPEIADPLTANEARTYTHEGKHNFRTRNVIACFDETQITHPENRSTANPETAALAAQARPPAIAFKSSHYTRGKDGAPSAVAPPLTADADKGDQDALVLEAAVRRLTPRECERLQGFPDDYTLVPYKGKPAKDTHRYRALGLSMAVTVIRWIGAKLKRAHKLRGAA